MIILLFLLNVGGSIGPTGGYYFPSLDKLNSWLLETYEAKSKIGASFTVGVNTRLYIGRSFALDVEADYFKANSGDELRSLLLVPADVYLSYKHMLLPALLYFYIGAGFELCFTRYEEGDTLEESNWGSGPTVKTGIEFIPTPNLGVELSGGYRFVKAPDVKLEDPDTGPAKLPINLWGGFFKLVLKRQF